MHGCQSFYWCWMTGWAKRSLGAQLVKWVLKAFTGEKGRNFLACCCTFDNFEWRKWTTTKRFISVDFLFPFVPWSQVSLNIALWLESAIQDNEKLIYRWETKSFALLTSCWLSVELHLVVACHQMALGWWIHFQGTTLEHFDSNICLTVKTVASSWKYICGKNERISLQYLADSPKFYRGPF